MAQLATVATIAASAANVVQGFSQSRASSQNRSAAAQQQQERQLEQQQQEQLQQEDRRRRQAAENAQLQAQSAERARQRQVLLEKTVASTRARLAASGTSPDEGSGAALIGGLRKDAADAQAAEDQQLGARIAENDDLPARMSAGRRSLIDESGNLTGFTRAVRSVASLGSGLRSLLDAF
jgi:vacuolar-type H+-ATPase subunit E/Vma4